MIPNVFLPIIFFIINFKQISKPSKVFSNPLNFKTIVTCFVMIGCGNILIFYLTYFYCFLGRGKIQQQKD